MKRNGMEGSPKIKVLFKIGLPYDMEEENEQFSEISVSEFEEAILEVEEDL